MGAVLMMLVICIGVFAINIKEFSATAQELPNDNIVREIENLPIVIDSMIHACTGNDADRLKTLGNEASLVLKNMYPKVFKSVNAACLLGLIAGNGIDAYHIVMENPYFLDSKDIIKYELDALEFVTIRGHVDLINALQKIVQIDHLVDENNNLFVNVCKYGHIDIIKTFAQPPYSLGHDVAAKNKYQALEAAIIAGHKDIVKILMEPPFSLTVADDLEQAMRTAKQVRANGVYDMLTSSPYSIPAVSSDDDKDSGEVKDTNDKKEL